MGSVQDDLEIYTRKRPHEGKISSSACLVVPPIKDTLCDDQDNVEAGRKKSRLETTHSPRTHFTAASAHDRGSRVDMEGKNSRILDIGCGPVRPSFSSWALKCFLASADVCTVHCGNEQESRQRLHSVYLSRSATFSALLSGI